jgi:hypothetical protein
MEPAQAQVSTNVCMVLMPSAGNVTVISVTTGVPDTTVA